MMKTVNAGKLLIGAGMPKIAVPVTGENAGEVKQQGEQIMRTPADLVELRADYLKNLRGDGTIEAVLSALREAVPDRPVLFTIRTMQEGGEADLSAEEYSRLCRKAMDTGLVEMIDIEWSGGATAARLLEYARQKGIVSVLSSHNFQDTPSAARITEAMENMASAGADIVKTAVMPQTDRDVLTLLEASAELKKRLSIPFILISMGEKGVMSRLAGEQFGSAVTFARAGRASAPGQMDADELDRVLRILHRGNDPEEKTAASADHSPSAGRNIALIGFMGTGKSTVSRALCRITGRQSMEIDDLLVEKAGMSIPEVFEKYGEPYFRDLEELVCGEVSAGPPSIISCGGGTPMRQANVDRLRAGGVIVLLEADPDTVYDRVKRTRGDRPMLAEYMSRGYISWLMKQREEAYRRAADLVVTIEGKTPEEIAEEILGSISSL